MMSGAWGCAEEAYLRALEIDDNQPHAILERGIISFHCGQLETAAELLERVLPTVSKDSRALYYLGKTYQMLGKIEKAIAMLSRFVEVETATQMHSPSQSALQVLEGVKGELAAIADR